MENQLPLQAVERVNAARLVEDWEMRYFVHYCILPRTVM
jgi:hypothetical protein